VKSAPWMFTGRAGAGSSRPVAVVKLFDSGADRASCALWELIESEKLDEAAGNPRA
jgi:hypothetical protein